MKKIVILGQSSGVFELAKSLREADASADIAIVSIDGQLPHDQSLLVDYLGKKISRNQVLCANKDFYQQNKIDVILDQKLERISLRQKKLTTESKEHIKFDTLVIADAPQWRFPCLSGRQADVKGMQKQGVYHVHSLGAVEKIYQQLPFAKSVVIQVYHWEDLKIALALKQWGRQVEVIVPWETRMARMVEHDVCEAMVKPFNEESWKLYYGQSITEVLGDSEAKAVRLSSACLPDRQGKVLAADMVIMGQTESHLRMLEDVVSDNATRISVQADLQTSTPNVYAFGDVASANPSETYWPLTVQDWKGQAEKLVNVIGGRTDVRAQRAVPLRIEQYAFNLENWSLKVLGNITPMSNAITFRSWNAETHVYQKIVVLDGKVQGAVLINAPRTDVYDYLLSSQANVAGCEKHVLDAGLSLEQLQAVLANPPKDHVEDEAEYFSGEDAGHSGATGHAAESARN